jgi:hypothetical protein
VGAARICPACSQPVRSGVLRLYESGTFYHVYCRSRQLHLHALAHDDRMETPVPILEGRMPSDAMAKTSSCPILLAAGVMALRSGCVGR